MFRNTRLTDQERLNIFELLRLHLNAKDISVIFIVFRRKNCSLAAKKV